MPIFRLTASYQFPPTELADENGLLAIGGDLDPRRLITAYSQGIFPWYSEDQPLLWWYTSPRLVLFPDEFRIPKRLQRYVRNSNVTVTINRAFREVITRCATSRTKNREDTWIMPEMIEAYCSLHQLGYAHSFESWQDGKLAGGLYGVALDRIFFGESMFSSIRSGSQFALIGLVSFLETRGYKAIDCQMTTDHLLRFGAREISGSAFKNLLDKYAANLAPQRHREQEIIPANS